MDFNRTFTCAYDFFPGCDAGQMYVEYLPDGNIGGFCDNCRIGRYNLVFPILNQKIELTN